MNKLAMAISLAAGLALQSTANAGLNTAGNVVVSSGVAYGAVTDTRYSGNTREYIGCAHSATKAAASNSTLNLNYISCSATDATGRSYYCSSYNPPQQWIDSVSGVNTNTWVYFWADANGNCLGLYMVRGSAYL